MTTLRVTYHAGHQGTRQVMNVEANPDQDHDTLARIIAVNRTGNPAHRHVLTIDNVELLSGRPASPDVVRDDTREDESLSTHDLADPAMLLDLLTKIVNHTETVDTYAADFYDHAAEGINRAYLMSERLNTISRVLMELDQIVSGEWEVAPHMNGFLPVPEHIQLLNATINRARDLAAAIRAAISVVVEL